MAREMCNECPFNPNSHLYHLKEEWVKYLDSEMFTEVLPMDGSVAKGCHKINDTPGVTSDFAEQCVGHLRHLSMRGEQSQ